MTIAHYVVAVTAGMVVGFFAASMFAVGHISDLHEHYQKIIEEMKRGQR